MATDRQITVRNTLPTDFPGIISLCQDVYQPGAPWHEDQLKSHLRVFPEGQFVAIDEASQQVVGMSASLIVFWDDYDMQSSWRDFTDHGMFTNHDPVHGRTLYGAEIMIRPSMQGCGIGSKVYQSRRDLVRRLGLLRIRAGARLRGYHAHSARMSPEEYVMAVIRGELKDPTLSFQLKHGFHVIGVVSEYLRHDPESLGHAAVIEWTNPEVAKAEDYSGRDLRYQVSGANSAGS